MDCQGQCAGVWSNPDFCWFINMSLEGVHREQKSAVVHHMKKACGALEKKKCHGALQKEKCERRLGRCWRN